MSPCVTHTCWACSELEDAPGAAKALRSKTILMFEDLKLWRSIEVAASRIGRFSFLFVVIVLLIFLTGRVDATPGSNAGSSAHVIFKVLAAIAVLTVSVIGLNTIMLPDKQVTDKVAPLELPLPEEKKRKLAFMLSDALKIPTISHDKDAPDGLRTDHSTFLKLHAYLKESFPLVHSSSDISLSVINDFSLLYEWKGENNDLEPVMLCAHLDVVPTPNAKEWSVDDPFGGHIDANGVVWGRGAIDNKHNVLMQLAAVESMLEKGQKKLQRTVFLAYGHDEEIGGLEGALHIAKEMKRRLSEKKVQNLAFILDEGSFLIKGIIPGVEKPVALIGIAEKGNISIKMSVRAEKPGHSSMPPDQTNVGILGKAIQRLEAHQFEPSIKSFIETVSFLGSHLPFWLRIVVSNSWLFGPIIKYACLSKRQTAASVRTTTAITIVRAGQKINVLPGEANAWVNHRIHPVDRDKETVLERDRKIINDRRVELNYASTDNYVPVAPVSTVDSSCFQILQTTVAECFNGAPVAPSVMIGNTDTRHYWELSRNIYRFTPVVFERVEDTSMFHGIDERISSENLSSLLHFYSVLLEHCDTDNF